MNRATWTLLALTALCSAPLHAQEAGQVTFFGITIGKPLTIAECRSSPLGNRIEYSIGTPSKEPCFKRKSTQPGSAEPPMNEMTTIVWPVLQGPEVGIPGAMGARVVDGMVEYIELYTRGARVQEVAFDQLLAKFGQPRSTAKRPLQTRMGVQIESIDANWASGPVTVVLQGVTSSLDQGQIVVATDRGIAAQKAAIEAILGPRTKM